MRVFRKTAATILDEAGPTARVIANRLGHSRPSMPQNMYMSRKAISREQPRSGDSADEPLTLCVGTCGGVSLQQRTPGRVTWGFAWGAWGSNPEPAD